MSNPNSQHNQQPKRRYYFWKYDRYPYLLGGPGVRLPNGMVETDNYGKGFHFNPCYEFSLKDGRQFHNELKRLEAERDKALDDIQDLYARRLNALRLRPYVVDGIVVQR